VEALFENEDVATMPAKQAAISTSRNTRVEKPH